MPHCTKCGAAVAENTAFCGACGAPQAAPGTPAPAAGTAGHTQMAENVAGMLCYLLGWVTGLVFFLIDKRPFVRFHAAQSIVLFGGLNIITYILGMFFGMGYGWGWGWGAGGFSFIFLMYRLVELVAFLLWILLMIRAYQGARFRLPVVADLADSIFGKN